MFKKSGSDNMNSSTNDKDSNFRNELCTTRHETTSQVALMLPSSTENWAKSYGTEAIIHEIIDFQLSISSSRDMRSTKMFRAL